MKRMSPDGKMADDSIVNEQIMRDAKQQGRQGNLIMEGGRMVIVDDDAMGGKAALYSWGQNETEVLFKHSAKELSSRQVNLHTTSKRVRLIVKGEMICEGELHKSIISDESTFIIEDAPGGERLLTVTLTKAEKTSGNEHWACAIKGQAKIDTKKFGPSIVTVNPNDPTAVKNVLGSLNK